MAIQRQISVVSADAAVGKMKLAVVPAPSRASACRPADARKNDLVIEFPTPNCESNESLSRSSGFSDWRRALVRKVLHA